MLNTFFVSILNMSISAGWMILVIMGFRWLFQRVPRRMICFLWALVAFRLIVPVSIESKWSLIPSVETFQVEGKDTLDASMAEWGNPSVGDNADSNGNLNPGNPMDQQVSVSETIVPIQTLRVNSGFETIDRITNDYMHAVMQEDFDASGELTGLPVSPAWKSGSRDFVAILNSIAYCWLAGIVVFFVCALWSYTRLRKIIRVSVKKSEGVFFCDHIATPFILGFFSPKIYLPSSMKEDSLKYVLDHEMAHLKRKDHWWKLLGYWLLAIHWFNPLVWAAYVLFCRDIELACDERVVADKDGGYRKAYAMTLLSCSMPGKGIAAYPLAFGETSVKKRILSVMNKRKPSFWISMFGVAFCLVVAVCFLTGPKTGEDVTSKKSGEKEDSMFSAGEPRTFESTMELSQFYRGKLAGKLMAEGKIRDESCLYGTLFRIDSEGYPLIQCWRGDFTMITDDGQLQVYRTDITLEYKNDQYTLKEEKEYVLGPIRTYQEAMEVGTVLLYDGQEEYLCDVIADAIKERNEKAYGKLCSPDTAAEFLLHLEGGYSECMLASRNQALVTYTFDSGEAVHYLMRRMSGCLAWQVGMLYEENSEARDSYLESVLSLNDAMQKVTAQTLRGEDVCMNDNLIPWQGGTETTKTGYAILDSVSGQDVALYGKTSDSYATVLRIGEKVYPLYIDWDSLYWGTGSPILCADDYDNDGEMEYSFVSQWEGGTECYEEILYMADMENGELVLYEFGKRDWMEQLEKNISYQYDEKQHSVELFSADGGKMGEYPIKEESFGKLSFGEVQHFTMQDEGWYFDTRGSVRLQKSGGKPFFNSGIQIVSPVRYEGGGRFSLCGISSLCMNE